MNEQQITNNDEGISLLDIIKVILRRKRIFCITTLAIAIIGILAIMLGYNKYMPSYAASFEYTYPSLINNEYIDGSKFDYRTLTSLDTLEQIKNSNSSFSSIDVEELYENDDIKIELVYDDEEEKTTYSYYISIASKYFRSAKQAKDFIIALTTIPTNKNLELTETITHDSYLTLFDDSNIYESQVSMLESQYNLLMSKYNNLIGFFSDVVLSDGKVMSTKVRNIEANFNSDYLGSLYDEIRINGYIKENSIYKNHLEVRKETLQENLEINNEKLTIFENKIKAITDTSTNSIVIIESYTQEIVKLVNENSQIEKEIKEIELKLDGINDSKNFEIKLLSYRNKLEEFTKQYCSVETEMVNKNSEVFYGDNSIIKVDGNIGIITGAVFSLAVGIICACCLNLVLGRKDFSKKNQKEEQE